MAEPIHFAGQGYSTTPCPGCGEVCEPNQERVTEPGVWRPWHAVCFEAPAKRCACCGENHADGSCLL